MPSHLALFVIALAVATVAARVPQPAALQPYTESLAGTTISFEMVPVPAGSVMVDGEQVAIKPFHIGRHEVTWDLYDVFALKLDEAKDTGGADAIARPSQPYGAPDYGWGHAGYPAISIARGGAEAFCEWLSKKTGKRYRLPTEAEWAHAAALAAGVSALESAKVDALAWHRGNADSRTHPVGKKQADALGLFDLFGNAAEWVASDGDTRIVRGGSFRDAATAVGPSARVEQDDAWNERDPQLPKSKWWLSDAPFVGFRIVRSAGL